MIRAGLQIRLAPGWKTYWRSAGDAGFPPGFDWSGSKNLKRVEVHWPAPKRFTAFDLDSFGYSHEVVFPLSLIPERPDEEMRLELAVNYGICADICIPAQGRLSLLLPAGPGEESIEAALISAFEKRLPAPSRKGGMELVEAVAEAGGAFKVVARSRAPFSEPDLFVEEESGIYFGRPRVELREEGRVAVFRFETESPRNRRDEEKGLDGVEVTLTLTDGERAVERRMVIGSRR